ncbi:MAG: MFS transporter [Firmicutes bacterium]|nr:MFS transporter [Bacillota bacterium]
MTKVQRDTVIVAILTSVITTFMGSATNLAIPNMSADLSVGAAAIGWVVVAYMLPTAALSVPFGGLADRIGRKKVLVAGVLVFTVMAFVAALAPTFPLLLAARAIQAAGAAMIFATNHAVLISEFPGSQRGRALGYALASTYVGLSLGPVLGGVINHYIGWRAIFVFSGLVGVVAVYAAAAKLPNRPSERKTLSFDKVGNILYVLMIVCVMYGLNAFSSRPAMILLVPVGLVFAVFFIRREAHQPDPLVDVRLFATNKAYSMSNLATLMNYGATYAIGYLLSIYLQVVLGYPSQIAGLILIVQTVIMAAFSPRMGRLSDRISPFKLASAGMGLCAVSLFMLVFITTHTPVWMIIIVLIFAGSGFALFSSPNTNAVMSCVDRESYGVASSVLATMRNIGHTSSMVIVTIIIQTTLGDVALAQASPEALVHTMRIGYIVFSLICVAGIFVSLARNKEAMGRPKTED